MNCDICIPYKHSLNDDQELRYTLRSIEKHLKGFRDVYIIGDRPSWIQNAYYIPTLDFKHFKQSSIANKMMIAAELETVSEDYLRWDDDHVLLKDLNATDIKYWHGKGMSFYQRRSGSQYRDTIISTIELLGDQPYYDIHTPIIINKEKFKALMRDVIEEKKELLIKSTYCVRAGVKGERYFEYDFKIDASMAPWIISRELKGRTFFTLGENGWSISMQKVLNNLFPNKSKYEN